MYEYESPLHRISIRITVRGEKTSRIYNVHTINHCSALHMLEPVLWIRSRIFSSDPDISRNSQKGKQTEFGGIIYCVGRYRYLGKVKNFGKWVPVMNEHEPVPRYGMKFWKMGN